MLQAALDYVPGSVLSEMIEKASSQKELAEFIPKYKTFKVSPKSKYVDSEAAINAFGYALLGKQRVAEAIEVFKLNVEAYPNSANVYDSLGDAYQAPARKEERLRLTKRL